MTLREAVLNIIRSSPDGVLKGEIVTALSIVRMVFTPDGLKAALHNLRRTDQIYYDGGRWRMRANPRHVRKSQAIEKAPIGRAWQPEAKITEARIAALYNGARYEDDPRAGAHEPAIRVKRIHVPPDGGASSLGGLW